LSTRLDNEITARDDAWTHAIQNVIRSCTDTQAAWWTSIQGSAANAWNWTVDTASGLWDDAVLMIRHPLATYTGVWRGQLHGMAMVYDHLSNGGRSSRTSVWR
jgi:hypothetical protein